MLQLVMINKEQKAEAKYDFENIETKVSFGWK